MDPVIKTSKKTLNKAVSGTNISTNSFSYKGSDLKLGNILPGYKVKHQLKQPRSKKWQWRDWKQEILNKCWIYGVQYVRF